MSIGKRCANCGMQVMHASESDGDILLFHDEGDYSRSRCRFPGAVDGDVEVYETDTFASRLYEAKQVSGVTYEELAEQFGVHQSAVKGWTAGEFEASGENRERVEEWIAEQLDDDGS